MADEIDLFEATQNQESDEEDTYTMVASEIAVQKIRLEQKKEKARALVLNLKKIIEDKKRAEKERDRLKQLKEEIQKEKVQKVTNLKKWQETRVSLEAALDDLNLKVNLKKAETQCLEERCKAKIKDAEETLESYLKIYQQFPLAIKVRENESKLKNVLLDISLTKNAIQDTKARERTFKEITRQRQHAWAVSLAKQYRELQEKTAETHKLQEKQRNLVQFLEDIKSGKITSSNDTKAQKLPKSFPTTHVPELVVVKPMREKFEFKMPRFPINSPPLAKSSQSFNWETLLKGISFASKSQPNKQDDQKVRESANRTLTFPSQLAASKKILDTNKTQKNTATTHTLAQKDCNIKSQANPSASCGEKRKSNESEEKNNQPLYKKISVQPSEVNKINESPLIQQTHKEIQSAKVHATTKELPTNTVNKENSQPTDSHEVINNIKTVAALSHQNYNSNKSSAITKQREQSGANPGRNLDYSLFLKQKGVQLEKSLELPKSSNSDLNAKSSITTGNTEYNAKKNSNTISQCENPSQSDEGMLSLMNPNSPPDIVPLGNNSQPPSQPQSKHNSQLSDFTSPMELNEKEKEIYKKLAAESMYDSISPTTEDLLKEKPVVKSKYFFNLNPLSQSSQEGELNTPDVASGAEHGQSPKVSGGYKELDFSPPLSYFSPPAAHLGATQSDQGHSGDKSGFESGNKSPEGGFCFSFGSGPSKNSSSSIFSLF